MCAQSPLPGEHSSQALLDAQKLFDQQWRSHPTGFPFNTWVESSNCRLISCQRILDATPIECISLLCCLACPEDYVLGFGGSCFRVSRDFATWAEARADCLQTENSDLVEITSENMTSYLQSETGNGIYWIGKLPWGLIWICAWIWKACQGIGYDNFTFRVKL